MYYLQNVYSTRSICTALLDVTCLLVAFAAAWVLVDPQITGLAYGLMAAGTVGVAATVIFFNDGYQPAALGDPKKTTTMICVTMGLGLVAAVGAYFGVSDPRDVTPLSVAIAGIFFPLLTLERRLVRLALGTKLLKAKLLVIGATDLGSRIADALDYRRNSGIQFIGFLSDDMSLHRDGASFEGFPILGRVHQLEKILAEERVDYIVVASKDREEDFPEATLMKAKTSGVHVESGVHFLERLSGRICMRDLRLSYLIFGKGFHRAWHDRFLHRSLDLVGASLLMAVTSPLIALTALAIKLDSPGPVLYRQLRLGKDNKPFMMTKLRSMTVDAESECGAVFTKMNDARITRVGQLIRRTRLDELPQLWNVLRGEMSMVGPRAERPEFAEVLTDRYPCYRLRTTVRPGITGWAQTRYGYVSDVEAYEEKISLDLYYLKYRSFLLDLSILAQTVKTVLFFRGT